MMYKGAFTICLQALGASIRIFELLDRKSKVSSENGESLLELDGCKY